MRRPIITAIIILQIFFNYSFAQRGKDGVKNVNGKEVVNAFTTLTVDANAGSTNITVANSNLNANFSGNLSQGDLLMIIQIQGVSVEDTIAVPWPSPLFANSSKFHSTWGRIINYNNCGNYEFVQVLNVPNATTINFDCALQYNYTTSGKVLVIRVPRYSSLTINNGDTLTTSQWNGTSGGVLAVEVEGTTTIDNGGAIDVTGLGFRGGVAFNASSVYGGLRYADANVNEGAQKGEGIAGDQTIYATFNDGGATQCRGAAANAGGGGNAHNAGGGGGANAGNVNNWNNGVGNPDISSANYITAWNLETSQSGLSSATVSSGGGRGGYSFFSSDRNELSIAPGNGTWGGDNRGIVGGLGGRPLDYSTGKIFIGGAGGAGEGNDNEAGNGGNGGGIIFLTTYDNITGAGTIISNGADGGDVIGVSPPAGQVRGKDAAGGAGAGGTIILQSTGTVSLTGSISTNGGTGGSQQLAIGVFGGGAVEGEGPGGGGGGGYIAISSGSPTRTANGGANGVTNCSYVSNFPPNGATIGGVGLPNASIPSFDFAITDTSICTNTSTTLTASISGTAPSGATIEWFDAEFGGTLLFSGASYTTPVLATTTTYWVRVCPAPYLVPVTVTVAPCPIITTDFGSSDSTLCIGDCIDFNDLSVGSPTGWTWYFPGASTTTSSTQNPTNICYNSVGSFDVSLVASDGVTSDSLYMPNFITVNALPVVIASNDTSICIGDSVNLSASGALTYNWDNGLGAGQNQTPFPIVNTTYTVTGTDGNNCSNSDQVIVTINALPIVVASNDTAICIGDSVNLSASGALTYDWDNGLGAGQNQTPFPIVNTTYTVTGTDGNNCSNSDQVIVTINSLPTVIASNDTAICIGDSVNLSASGASTYSWDNGLGAGQNQSPSPIINTTYTVTGTDGNNCSNTDQVIVTINALPIVVASNDTTICSGDSTAISANGALSYNWDNGLGAGQSQTPFPIINTTYTVTGTDANGCSNTDQVIVIVSACGNPPVVNLSANDSVICVGDCIDFNDLSTGVPSGWSWYFFGANTTNSSNQNPTNICYSSAGSFDVALVSSNAFGQDSLFISGFITVNALPTIVASNDTTICSGDSAAISATGALTYNWNNGLGAGQNQTPFPIVNTTYTVTGTDANGCANSDSVVVTVAACGNPPVVSFSANDSVICVGDCIDFNDLSTGVPSGWSWYFFGAATTNSNAQNPTNICYNSAGSFDVALVSSNAFGQDSLFISGFITVNALPTIIASNDTTICSGDSAAISAIGALTYNWDNGLGAGQNQTPFPIVNTTYAVTGTDINGCANYDSVVVIVISCNPPIANLASTNTIICINDCIDFSDLSSGGTPTLWSWQFFGANPSTSNAQYPINICYDSLGFFDVSLTVSNAFGQDSIFISNYITVDSCLVIPTEIVIPNVFSPNSDGQNDLFGISGNNIKTLHMEIYNRWGELMYQTDQLGSGWDGRTTSGTKSSDGTYFYIITTDVDVYKGTLTLIR